jgi:hypothetical protein
VGSAAAEGNEWWLVPAVAVFSYLVGLLVTLGQRLAVAGLQMPIALLIASGIPLRPGDAALRAVLVLAGGLWQAALVVASWALTPGGRNAHRWRPSTGSSPPMPQNTAASRPAPASRRRRPASDRRA